MSSRSSSTRRNTGRWTQEEHENFLKGIQQFGRNWDAIHELYVTTRNETQIRTHAQKYFQKVDRGLSFPEEPYGSTTGRGNADVAAQGGGGDGDGENVFYSNDAPAPTFAEGLDHFVVPSSTAAGAAAATAGAGNAGFANHGIPAGDYGYVTSPFQAAPPLFSGADQPAPSCPDFAANPFLGPGLPGWQMPSEGVGGMVGGGGPAADPGNGPYFGNRHAAGPDRTEDALLAAVADMDGYDSGTSFSNFDTRGGSPASWTGYSAGGTLPGPSPSRGGGPWVG